MVAPVTKAAPTTTTRGTTTNESALVNQSTLGKDLVNSGPTRYFTLFLAGGSSIVTLNCLKEERIV